LDVNILFEKLKYISLAMIRIQTRKLDKAHTA